MSKDKQTIRPTDITTALLQAASVRATDPRLIEATVKAQNGDKLRENCITALKR